MVSDPIPTTTNLSDWTCQGCGRTYLDPADVPPQCPDCGEYADHEEE